MSEDSLPLSAEETAMLVKAKAPVWEALRLQRLNMANDSFNLSQEAEGPKKKKQHFNAALLHAKSALALTELVHGEQSSQVADDFGLLGFFYYVEEKMAKAAGYFWQALTMYEQRPPADPTSRLCTLLNYGQLLEGKDYPDEAESRYEQMIEIVDALEHTTTPVQKNLAQSALVHLIDLNLKHQDFQRGESWCLKALDPTRESRYGTWPLEKQGELYQKLATVYYQAGKHDLARKTIEAAVERVKQASGSDAVGLMAIYQVAIQVAHAQQQHTAAKAFEIEAERLSRLHNTPLEEEEVS